MVRKLRGFTYVELTLVLTIIAVLAAIAVPNFLEAQVRATVTRSKADQALLGMAIEAYRLENKIYPQNAQPAVAGLADLNCLTTPVAFQTLLPEDPFFKHHTFSYVNGLQLDPDHGLKPGPEVTYGFNGAVLAMTWGVGPDRAYQDPNGQPRPKWPVITTSGTFELILYDPTNGTTSQGIIAYPLP